MMLEQFPHIVDVDFSAEMEKNLDKVESGKADWHKTVDDFYQGFAASLEQAEKNMEGKKVKVPDEPSSEVCDLCGRPMVIKVGKYGKFLACSGFPECRGTKRPYQGLEELGAPARPEDAQPTAQRGAASRICERQ